MNEQRLGKLLRRGDGGDAGGMHDAVEFAQRVRRVAAGRRGTRRMAQVWAVVAVVATMGWWSAMIWGPPRTGGPTLVATRNAPREIEDGQKASAEVDALELLDPVWQARDEAACTMVFMAQRREQRVGKEETQNQYARVIALFPESHWAEVARQETRKLQKQD